MPVMDPRWLELSEQLFPVAKYGDPGRLEAVVGGPGHHPELAQAAIAVVRAHPDPYLRERLAYDLGESPLIPVQAPPDRDTVTW